MQVARLNRPPLYYTGAAGRARAALADLHSASEGGGRHRAAGEPKDQCKLQPKAQHLVHIEGSHLPGAQPSRRRPGTSGPQGKRADVQRQRAGLREDAEWQMHSAEAKAVRQRHSPEVED